MNFKAKKFCELDAAEVYEILKSRSEVFMLEQRIICQDMDDVDYESIHCFIENEGRVLAYLRLFYKDDADTLWMGRVLTLCHGNGLGRELMEKSLEYIKSEMKCTRICMHSQKQVIGFYEKFGFSVTSDEFLEEGVVHVVMEKEIQ